MKKLYMKQKVFSLGENITVKNEQEEDVYFVHGSFMKIPKTFSVMNTKRDEIGVITKKTFSFLPKFFVEVYGEKVLTIKKELSFLKPRYSIDSLDMEVQGNWWEMEFQIIKAGEVMGAVRKEWFTWGASYQIEIMEEAMEEVVVAIVVAINQVKSDNAAATTTNMAH